MYEMVLLSRNLVGKPRIDGGNGELLDEDEPVIEIRVLIEVRVLYRRGELLCIRVRARKIYASG